MQKFDARTLLRISAAASPTDIEEAYRTRMREVRKRFETARERKNRSAREQCEREFAALKEARSTLLNETEEVIIEPEAAHVEPEAAHLEPEPARVEPEPAGVEPEPAWVEPEPARVEPEPAHVEPAAAHVEPEAAQVEPEAAQVEPEAVYVEPEAVYVEPKAAHVESKPAHVEPAAPRVEPEPAHVEDEATPVTPASNPRPTLPIQKPRLLIAGIILILGCVFAAIFFLRHSQEEHQPGKLALNTHPANANVFIDGVSRGITPLVLDGIVPGERHLRITLEGYQDEQLVVLIKPGDQRFFPLVTLIPQKESASTVTATPSPLVTATPSPPITATPSPPITATPSPPITATPSPPVTATPSPLVTATPSNHADERFPQTRERLLTEAEVANLDYADLQYAINEMYARHGAQFLKEPDLRKQFEGFSWYYPIPGITLTQIDAEFSRIEKRNRDLLARLRDQKRPRK
jgi:hypothetical protein